MVVNFGYYLEAMKDVYLILRSIGGVVVVPVE